MSVAPPTVVVAGGGIGGLAAALGREGCHVKVLEQMPEIGEIGAGIRCDLAFIDRCMAGAPGSAWRPDDGSCKELSTRADQFLCSFKESKNG